MTFEDQVYGDWLDLLGSDIPHTGLTVPEPELEIVTALRRLHQRSEASHHGPGCIGDPDHTGSCPTLTRPEEL